MATRASTRQVVPNARCPVCGALTYFYANEHGSRVYFDELGPPWPKHPCLLAVTGVQAPTPYRIAPVHDAPGNRAAPGFGSWGLNGPWKVCAPPSFGQGTMLHLHPLRLQESVSVWHTPYAVALRAGDLVFLRNGWISWFDHVRFEVVTAPVSFVATASRWESPLRRLVRRLLLATW